MTLRRLTAGAVYFVRGRATRRIKIGVTTDVAGRMVALQSASADRLDLLALIHSDRADSLERFLHGRFHRYREHGEWFRPGRELVAYIDSLSSPPDPNWYSDPFEEFRHAAEVFDPLPLPSLLGRAPAAIAGRIVPVIAALPYTDSDIIPPYPWQVRMDQRLASEVSADA